MRNESDNDLFPIQFHLKMLSIVGVFFCLVLILTTILFFTDTMIRNGDVELKAREEEIRFLKMEVKILFIYISYV